MSKEIPCIALTDADVERIKNSVYCVYTSKGVLLHTFKDFLKAMVFIFENEGTYWEIVTLPAEDSNV
jgi:hypothetical protein